MSYQDLLDNNIVIKGNFVLKSGEKSNYYVDIKKTIGIPDLFNKIIDKLYNKIKRIKNYQDYSLLGVPYAGIPFASVLSYKLNIPLLMMRKEVKEYGTKKRIEGETENRKLILIEDVMTTGKSIMETINYLHTENYEVDHVFTIFQRNPVDYQKFKSIGVEYSYTIREPISLETKLQELIPEHPIYKRLYEISQEKKSNLILSVDVVNMDDFFLIIDECAREVVAIKIHLDIFNESNRDMIRKYLAIKKKHFNFLVIEDRKFSDICNTNLLQAQALRVEEYADIVISHGICGFEFARHCPLPILLVSQLSNNGNIIDSKYTEECIKGQTQYKNIIGLISQENLGVNKCLYCKPGIRLDILSDGFDQNYTGFTPGIDFYIVGRGITESKKPLETARYYKYKLYNS